jgi:XTP/dITP diphosphohydrolase
MNKIKELVLASRNKKKIAELKDLLPGVSILSLDDIGFQDEIEEPFETFKENARQKAQVVYEFCGLDVLADDSGISVPALGNAPGVFSARYAGPGASDEENLQKLLSEMASKTDRRAFYTAMLCLMHRGEAHYFVGTCYGTILETPKGSGGFGYDPAFVPEGYTQTFGELDPSVKQQISHRAQAMRALHEFLNR